MTDSSIPDVPAFADALTPLERAKLGLHDELSVFEIGLLTYPGDGDQERRRGLAERLLDAIKAGQLAADGDPDGWRTTVQFFPGHEPQTEGRFSWFRRHRATRVTPQGRVRFVEGRCGIVRVEEQDWHGDNCLVTRMDYRAFLATPAARGIPEPDWPACPRLADTAPCNEAKAFLNASDADMCAWTLNRSLTAYQESSDRLERFEWPNVQPDDKPDDKLLPPWRHQLAVLRFSRAELEHFRPDLERRYLTCGEALDRVQRTFPGTTREAIRERLLLKARPGKDQINCNLVAISPRPISERNRKTLRGCVFRADQIDRFARECGEEQRAVPPSETMDPDEAARLRVWEGFRDALEERGLPDFFEKPHPEPGEPFDRPRTRNARPVGLTGDYRRWKRLDTHPEPDSLEWQARDGRLRVAIKAHRLRARLVPGHPDSGRSGFDEYTEGWWRDGTPPKGSPLLLIEGYWYLDGQEAFYVLRDGQSRNINWLYPPDPAELHRLWPDLFPDGEFYLDLESWRPVRREDLFWLDAPGQPATDPTPAAPTFLQGEPDKPEPGAAANKAALSRLLDELDKRAAEQGAGFDRRSLPGTKREFHKLLNAYHPPFGYMNTQNLADEYLKGKCQFQRGAKPEHGKGAAILALFPEYPLK
ncbi:MAG: hypothetical protein JNJ76_01270 [Candidatus Competibacter sp.]|nr:hypothetical protein [Candidatus Competibacter sp.]